MRDEDSLIRTIARAVPSVTGRSRGSSGLVLGIGDDGAILDSRPGQQWVISCDAFIEGVHFLVEVHPPDSAGYKALVRAASDLVAMGATPRLFLLTLALPQTRTGPWLDEFLRGMRRAARYLDMRLAGGDTTASRTISISITVLGEIEAGRRPDKRHAGRVPDGQGGAQPLTRSGGHPGDRIYVSGTLGLAQIGLELIRRGRRASKRPNATKSVQDALRVHLYPRLRVELGRWLSRNRVASAMMDLSDGLSTDLARLCRASGVGAKLYAARIPVVSPSADVLKLLPRRSNLLNAALHGGDDYELLFTVPATNEKRLRGAPDSRRLACIGELTRERRIVLLEGNGNPMPLESCGWDPFRDEGSRATAG